MVTDELGELRIQVQRLEDQLCEELRVERHARHHDDLTGMPNELSLQKHLKRTSGCWFVVCDLDGFKAYQDKRGSHRAGDKVLCAFSQFLQSCTRQKDDRGKDDVRRRMACRLHGDEFVVVTQTQEGAEGIAQRIRGWSFKGQVTSSVGVGRTMALADASMYRAKRAKRSAKRVRVLKWVLGAVALVGLVWWSPLIKTQVLSWF